MEFVKYGKIFLAVGASAVICPAVWIIMILICKNIGGCNLVPLMVVSLLIEALLIAAYVLIIRSATVRAVGNPREAFINLISVEKSENPDRTWVPVAVIPVSCIALTGILTMVFAA